MTTIQAIKEAIAAKAGHRQPWLPKETKVWQRRVQNPQLDRMAGVRIDPAVRALSKKLIEGQVALAHHQPKLGWDGARMLRRRGKGWDGARSDWQVGAAGKGGTQGDCKACVAFATIAAVEARLLLKDPARFGTIDLSEARLFNCGSGGDCAQGWDVSLALEHAFTSGFVLETNYVSPLGTAVCPVQPSDVALLGADMLNPKLPATRETIASDGPVIAVMSIYEDFLSYVDRVEPYWHAEGALIGLHAVAIVGSDDQGWIGLNSWGPDWGDNGFFRILYGECDLEDYWFFAPIV